MLTREGPKLIEYNVRFGDPECQALMPRLMSDLLPALLAARDGVLDGFDLRWYPDSAVAVVLAAKGYPGDPLKGSEITGLAEAAQGDPAVKIFHAGTKRIGDKLVADGGRVLTVAAWNKDVAAARDKAYAVIDRIRWPEGFCRRDIGWRVIARPR
jgi:phosphoribosylamine--glycine ligase